MCIDKQLAWFLAARCVPALTLILIFVAGFAALLGVMSVTVDRTILVDGMGLPTLAVLVGLTSVMLQDQNCAHRLLALQLFLFATLNAFCYGVFWAVSQYPDVWPGNAYVLLIAVVGFFGSAFGWLIVLIVLAALRIGAD